MRPKTDLAYVVSLFVVTCLACAAPAAGLREGALSLASRDTVALLGGPDRWDGRFETPEGLADWHGWTSYDYSATADSNWIVSTFNAEALGGHGAGNHALWCGRDFGGGVAGYGNDWLETLEWKWSVVDPGLASTVAVQAFLNHDTEPGFDQVVLRVRRAGGIWEDLASWEGWRINRAIAVPFTVDPADYAGANGDQIRLRWVFTSDGAWSDADGAYPTDGGCQLDDVSVTVDGAVVTFDDFESGSPVSWRPMVTSGGDFAHLAQGLLDLDPCREDASWQLCFVDDGVVVPETGGSPCLNWCYGPGGYVLNATGGLLGATNHLENGVKSPPLAWPAGCDQARLAFNVWRHDEMVGETPGMVYRWRVRSTSSADSTALAQAPWRDRGDVLCGSAAYLRHEELLGDLLEPGRTWIQVELGVYQMGWLLGLDGSDATPAPYFDDVAVAAWPVTAPQIVVRAGDLPQDTFPTSGRIDLGDLGANSCRFDMARNISPADHLRNDPGDSIVASIARLRNGGIWLGMPRLIVRVYCNSLFNPYRVIAPPNGLPFVETTVQGDSCRTPDGKAVPHRWFFDLPDEHFIFPGDVLHFAFTATDYANGQIGMASWPTDTTGFSDFGERSIYPTEATMRALPSVANVAGDQPGLLVWRDFTTGDSPAAWDYALANLGLHEGVDYDLFVTRDPDAGLGNGLGGRAISNSLAGYHSVLYAGGDHSRVTISTENFGIDASHDLPTLFEWLVMYHGRLLVTGDNVASSLVGRGGLADLFLSTILGVTVGGTDVAGQIGGQTMPLVLPIDGNPIIHDVAKWRVQGACPTRRTIDSLVPVFGGTRLAEFAAPNGQGGAYPVAAAVLYNNAQYQCQAVTLPMALSAIVDVPGENQSGQPLPARARLLGEILTQFGTTFGDATDVPDAGILAVRNFPNPFNPSTTIAYNLPRAGRATLKVYDLRGRLVRTLLDSDRPAGSGRVTWDGADAAGAAVASGVYFHELLAGGETRLGKMTLLK